MTHDDHQMQRAYEEACDKGWSSPEELFALAWQASREALVVELPLRQSLDLDLGGWPQNHGADTYNRALDHCRAAIHAAGVTVKP